MRRSFSGENMLHVLDYERASEVIKTASSIGIGICYCRHKMEHVGKNCSAPMDICMTFNGSADSLTRHGIARKAGVSEGIDLLQKARDFNLIQFGENVQDVAGIIAYRFYASNWAGPNCRMGLGGTRLRCRTLHHCDVRNVVRAWEVDFSGRLGGAFDLPPRGLLVLTAMWGNFHILFTFVTSLSFPSLVKGPIAGWALMHVLLPLSCPQSCSW